MFSRMIRSNSGFTMVEVLIMGFVVGFVILASSQANIHFIKNMKLIEKKAEVSGETQDLLMYLRRTSKNLTLRRVNGLETYVLAANSAPVPLGIDPNKPPPASSLTINTTQWLSGGQSDPLYSKAQAAVTGPQMSVVLNSFVLEEHGLRKVGNELHKTTRRLLVSRCDKIQDYFSLSDRSITRPGVPAFYVLAAMNRRPFVTYNSAGKASVRCCPVSNPACPDGEMSKHFFRSYAITFDNTGNVANVEEFPKSGTKNPVIGGGFGLYFANSSGTSVNIVSFNLVNTCQTTAGVRSPACTSDGLSDFLRKSESDPNVVRLDSRSISTTLSTEIAETGVISL